MRIVHLVHSFLPVSRAGTEHYVLELGLAQQALGHEVRVVHAAGAEPPLSGAPWSVLRHEVRGLPSVALAVPSQERNHSDIPRAAAFLAEELSANDCPADVLHVHGLMGWSLAALEAAPAACLRALTLHDFWFPCPGALLVNAAGEVCPGPLDDDPDRCARCLASPGKEQVLAARLAAHRRAFAELDLVLAPSRFSLSTHRRLGFDNPRLMRSPLGLAEPARVPRVERAPNAPLRFVFLGGMTWFKGPDIALDAFAHLPRGAAELHLHGSANNPPYLERLRAAAPEGVFFHGAYAKEDLPVILSRADAVVLPSRMETFSVVAREAHSAAVPVIASTAGALPEAVRDGRDGLLFHADSPGHLLARMRTILEDPDLLGRLSRNIRPPKSIERDARALLSLYASRRPARSGPPATVDSGPRETYKPNEASSGPESETEGNP